MFGEKAVLFNVTPISSAIAENLFLKISSLMGSIMIKSLHSFFPQSNFRKHPLERFWKGE